VDEEKARKSAVIAGYNVMGLLGLFILAKRLGFVDQIRPLIRELIRKKFRVSDRLVSEILKRVGE
jgi:predicted nucleic acid-binding protein